MLTQAVSQAGSILGAVTLASLGNAQIFQQLVFYFWGDYPSFTGPSDGYAMSTTMARKAIQVNIGSPLRISDDPPSPYNNSPWDSPEFVADWVAERIRREVWVQGRLTATTISITMQNFGFDSVRCDAGQGQPEPALGGARYFVSSLWPSGDRIPGILEWRLETPAADRFPQPRDERLSLCEARGACSPVPPGFRPDYGSARSYRHPFLRNADPTFNASTGEWNAPLKQWMQRFVNRLDANYLASLPTSQPLPNPNLYRFNYDTEAPIVSHADFNDVFMLKHLSNPANPYWNGPLLPGYGRTLRAQYIFDHPGVANPDGLSASLVTVLPAKDAQNRAAMRWYFEVCDRVNQEVMRNCTTDVLQAKWGDQASPAQPSMRCGNYDSFATDGQSDTFGWFTDRAWQSGGVSASNVNPLVGIPAQAFTRRMIHKSRGGLSYYIANQSHPRYISELTYTCGTLHSPVFYRLGVTELHGDDGPVGPEPGHARKNYYAPPSGGVWPDETEWDSAMRLHRHHAEAIINSASGDSSAFVPWLQMCASDPNDPSARLADDFTTYDETVRLLQMLRAKNIKEGLFFTAWYNRNNDPLWMQNLDSTWTQTQDAIKDVYASRVHTFRAVRGLSNIPAFPAVPDPSKLEFTLRVGVQDQTVDIATALSGPKVTEVDVDFHWPSGSSAAPPLISFYDVNLNVECSSSRSDVVGQALIWNFDSSQWIPLETEKYSGNFDYHFNAPQSTDSRYGARQSLVRQLSGTVVVKQLDPADGLVKSRIRLRHTGTTSFSGRYDLVQLRVTPGNGMGPPSEPQGYSLADTNFDGVVDGFDLYQYVQEHTEEVAAADLNIDHSIDESDLLEFMDAFHESAGEQ